MDKHALAREVADKIDQFKKPIEKYDVLNYIIADLIIEKIEADRKRIAADLREILSNAPDPEAFIIQIDQYSEKVFKCS